MSQWFTTFTIFLITHHKKASLHNFQKSLYFCMLKKKLNKYIDKH